MKNGHLGPRTLPLWRRFRKPLTGNALLIARLADRFPRSFADTALTGTQESSHEILRSLGLFELLRYADPKLLAVYAGERALGKLGESDLLQSSPEEIERAGREASTAQRAGQLRKLKTYGPRTALGLAAEERSQPDQ